MLAVYYYYVAGYKITFEQVCERCVAVCRTGISHKFSVKYKRFRENVGIYFSNRSRQIILDLQILIDHGYLMIFMHSSFIYNKFTGKKVKFNSNQFFSFQSPVSSVLQLRI